MGKWRTGFLTSIIGRFGARDFTSKKNASTFPFNPFDDPPFDDPPKER